MKKNFMLLIATLLASISLVHGMEGEEPDPKTQRTARKAMAKFVAEELKKGRHIETKAGSFQLRAADKAQLNNFLGFMNTSNGQIISFTTSDNLAGNELSVSWVGQTNVPKEDWLNVKEYVRHGTLTLEQVNN